MPDHTLNPRGEFDSLINEVRAFFAKAANRPIKAKASGDLAVAIEPKVG